MPHDTLVPSDAHVQHVCERVVRNARAFEFVSSLQNLCYYDICPHAEDAAVRTSALQFAACMCVGGMQLCHSVGVRAAVFPQSCIFGSCQRLWAVKSPRVATAVVGVLGVSVSIGWVGWLSRPADTSVSVSMACLGWLFRPADTDGVLVNQQTLPGCRAASWRPHCLIAFGVVHAPQLRGFGELLDLCVVSHSRVAVGALGCFSVHSMPWLDVQASAYCCGLVNGPCLSVDWRAGACIGLIALGEGALVPFRFLL